MRRTSPPAGRTLEGAATYVEIAMMTLIAGIMITALVKALQSTTSGALIAKERARAMTLAQDKLEEVKGFGYATLVKKFSNYVYPESGQYDPSYPLTMKKDLSPWPVAYGSGNDAIYTSQNPGPGVVAAAGEDPWTPELLQIGLAKYWRHVVVKAVSDDGTGKFVQNPEPSPPAVVGGTNAAANLLYIESAVVWKSRFSGKSNQIRLSSLVANPSAISPTFGSISGTVWDTNCGNTPGCKCDWAAADTYATPCDHAGDVFDRKISWASFIVTARNELTEEVFTGKMGSYGQYSITGLPYGSYQVTVQGAPLYLPGAYTGYTGPANSTYPPVNVTLDSVNIAASQINVWLQQVRTMTVHVRFNGVKGTSTNYQSVELSLNDGNSKPSTTRIDWDTDVTPCEITIDNVAWPLDGKGLYNLSIINKTAEQSGGATICMDASWPMPTDFNIGMDPPIGWTGCSGGCQATWPDLGADCADPGDPGSAAPITVGQNYKKARVKVKVMEFYDGAVHDFAAATLPKVSVKFKSSNDLVEATQGLATVASTGQQFATTVFEDPDLAAGPGKGQGTVPIQPSPTIKFTATIDTTGYQDDSYFLPFDTVPDRYYSLVPYDTGAEGGSPYPENQNQRYILVLNRVSVVSGTVWKDKATLQPFPNAVVRLYSDTLDWSTAVTADGSGRFVFPYAPVHSTESYKVKPEGGGDFVSTPKEMVVQVAANGHTYWKDVLDEPLEFQMTAINGRIAGTVRKGGAVVEEGALVIASTYNGAWPTTLPSTLLNGKYTYSTMALTDGTYNLKVATGVGNYYLYTFIRTNGVDYTCGPCGPAVAVTAGGVSTVDIDIP